MGSLRIRQVRHHDKRYFFARVEWEIERVPINARDLQATFREEVADVFGMQWSFWPGGRPMRLAIFVTTEMAHLGVPPGARQDVAELFAFRQDHTRTERIPARSGILSVEPDVALV